MSSPIPGGETVFTDTVILTVLEKGKDYAAINYFEPTGEKIPKIK